MDQQTQMLLAGAGIAILAFAFFAFRDVGKRRHRPRDIGQDLPPAKSQPGCDCPKPAENGCIAAVDCVPPQATPIVIRGLSCDPNDPQFVNASDIQMFVDTMNQQREQDRVADSITRFRSAFDRMNQDSPEKN